MTEFLPREVREGLEEARRRARRTSRRTRVRMDGEMFPIRDLGERGFLMDLPERRRLRGLVDVFDGTRHLFRALIVASAEEDDGMRYEFKLTTPASDAPALDYARAPDAPAGLLGGV